MARAVHLEHRQLSTDAGDRMGVSSGNDPGQSVGGLDEYKRRFEAIQSMQPVMRSRDRDGVTFIGALCWRVENERFEVYRKADIELRVVR